MKTIKDFTPEIQAKIPEYLDKYTKGVFDGGRYNSFKKENAEALIHWNYEKCGYKNPVVLVAENPYESQILFNYIKANDKVFTPILYLIYCIKNGIELPKLGYSPKIESEQLYSQLYSQLRSQLDSQLYSQLRSQLDSQLDSQLYSQLRSQLYSQLDSQLYSQLRSQLYSQLDSQLYSQLRSQLDSQLYSQLDSQLRSQLYSQLDSQLYSQLGKYNYDYLFTTNVYSNALIAWYGFMANELKIDAPINVDLNTWNDLYVQSGVYSAIFSELVCVVSKYPQKVHRNSSNDLHNTSGIAVEWGHSTDITQFDCYYVDGFNLGKEMFDKLSRQEITFEDFVKESNEEIKSSILAFYRDKFGDEFMFRFLSKNLKEIDNYVDKKAPKFLEGTTGGMNIGVYTLFKGRLMNEDIAFIRCYCPSTDRMFFLGVEPSNNSAKDAIASLYRVPRKLRKHISAINRQGEVYSTNFTDEGLLILKNLPKSDIQDLVGISGEEYFNKIKYEY
ncbi:hypothetical protein OHD16_06870 [Sphingobacterium sp. ML3W]|uniref:hypothetical protein n=1 Tax=Sphingobacterium sp. ML3W TaxID=1538644 RepID=UPI00249B40E3|nr:hypothetical protein [Sphingobacterium sp. ML3W]WFA79692.1 hypothetical protein OGI71_00010 [Sphingobacterium sp. ML3W]